MNSADSADKRSRLGIFNTEFMHLSYPLTADDRARIDAALEREREFVKP